MSETDDASAGSDHPHGIRQTGAHHARRLLSAYSGEHGVYGIVLVTALIAGEIDADTDDDVIVFVLGTVAVFWLAHIYAAVVASRAKRPAPPLRRAIRDGVRHSSGMALAMLIPVALLMTAGLGVDEWVAYFAALFSGILMLGAIGYLNARRNGSRWPWRIAGVLTTMLLGIVIILLSIAAH
jgi:hypothetical protein